MPYRFLEFHEVDSERLVLFFRSLKYLAHLKHSGDFPFPSLQKIHNHLIIYWFYNDYVNQLSFFQWTFGFVGIDEHPLATNVVYIRQSDCQWDFNHMIFHVDTSQIELNRFTPIQIIMTIQFVIRSFRHHRNNTLHYHWLFVSYNSTKWQDMT